ncbi:MAG: ribosome biogenesis GTPase Der [Calditrichaeota bacterium]|nr:MAG: ribosome biogenesis GTPase Der [Calditrichota bacterium]
MSFPIVAIIGRPNVGKSTLFNRIIRSRDAIVDDRPGVTRDRKAVEAEWAGRNFILVDTGGYMPERQDQIARGVVAQVEQAIAEADLLVFLVDARAGLTALDEEIARVVQKSGKKTVLAVNKVDEAASEVKAAEFYRLGFEDQMTISAANGRSVGDFLDRVVESLPPPKPSDRTPRPEISLAVIGRPNVGKSSFVNAILGEEKHIVTEVPGTTRDAIDTVFKYYGQEFRLIDTAGLRRKSRVTDSVEFYSTVRTLQSIKRCDVAVVLVDATVGLEMQDKRILNEAIQHKKGVILAVNKWDLVEKDAHTAKRFETEIRESLKKLDYLPILFVSALTKQRVFKVIEVAKSVYAERNKTIQTAALNRFLEQITQQYAPPSMEEREVKINYCTQVKSGPPVIVFFCNAPQAIKPNYRAFIENQLRARFGFFGVPLSLIFRKK